MADQNIDPNHLPGAFSRRDFLFRAGGGFGGLALSAMLAEDSAEARGDALPHGIAGSPLAARPAQFRARAKSVIFLFMVGGPSHIETFDPKPELDKMHGQPLPPSFCTIKSQ